MTQDSALLVAQLTDTHLFADEHRTMKGCPTLASLRAVVDRLSQVQPQPSVLLLTGDLSQDETWDSYNWLRDMIEPLGIPTYWLPGNHDQIPAYLEKVLATDVISPQKCFQRGGWNFVLLNSMLFQQVQGALSPEELTDLEQHLQRSPHLPTLIALHHPPLAIASEWMDRIGLENPRDLFDVIDRHPQVKLVIFGHIHQEFDQWRNGVRFLGTPSTCIQFAPQQDNMQINQDQPGFRLLWLHPDGRHTTQVERVKFEYRVNQERD